MYSKFFSSIIYIANVSKKMNLSFLIQSIETVYLIDIFLVVSLRVCIVAWYGKKMIGNKCVFVYNCVFEMKM